MTLSSPPQSVERLQSQTKICHRPCRLCHHIPRRRTPAYHRPRPKGIVVAAMKVAVVPSSPLVIVVIAIAADAPFGNRDEGALSSGKGTTRRHRKPRRPAPLQFDPRKNMHCIPRHQCKDVAPREASAQAAWIDQAEHERAPAEWRDLLPLHLA